MSIRFSPGAAICTAVIVGGFAAVLVAQMPAGLFGFEGMARDGLLPMDAGGEAAENHQRDIIGAVLIHEARRPGRANSCLSLADEGLAFEQEKRAIRALAERAREEPAARTRLTAEMNRLRNPQRPWLRPFERGLEQAPLGAHEAQQLRLAETTLLDAPPANRLDFVLDGSVVPAAFRSEDRGCNTLTFTAPAVAGEVAFVETSHRCGPECREGWLYAIVRRDGRWAVEAVARMP